MSIGFMLPFLNITDKKFLKLAGIQGDSQDPRHKGEFEILSLRASDGSQGGQSGGRHRGGSVIRFGFYVTMQMGTATVALFRASLMGQHIPEAKITIERRNALGQVYAKQTITMKDAYLGEIQTQSTAVEFLLEYQMVRFAY